MSDRCRRTGTAPALAIFSRVRCAQATCQLVASAMGFPTRPMEVTVNGDMDLQGTLGLSPEVAVDFQAIRGRFDLGYP